MTCTVTHPLLGRCTQPAGHDASRADSPHRYAAEPERRTIMRAQRSNDGFDDWTVSFPDGGMARHSTRTATVAHINAWLERSPYSSADIEWVETTTITKGR
jgi:hypothetical protein